MTAFTDPALQILAGITTGPDGALWFSNRANGSSNGSIGRITTSGAITTYADGNGASLPNGITVGHDGAVWFADSSNQIGRIATGVTPQINGFSPSAGPVGTTVTITGQNLAGATRVAVNHTAASIVSDSATQIVAMVPIGATTGPITATTAIGTASSNAPFTVN